HTDAHYTSSPCRHHSRYNLHLHSFPTRRSSDLHRCSTRRPLKLYRYRPLRPARRRGPIVKRLLPFPLLATAIFGMWVLLTGFSLDRKSTRLNSSHVEISYAVFCLKKKKTKSTRE